MLGLETPHLPVTPAPQQTPDPSTVPNIPQYTYTLIAEQLQGQSLFPGLRRLNITAATLETASGFSALPLIFGPSVDDVTITGAGLASPSFAEVCLPLLGQRSTRLQHISIQGTSIGINHRIMDTLLKFTELKTLDLRMPSASRSILPNDILQILRVLTKLIFLSLDIHFPHHRVSDPSFTRSASELGFHLPTLPNTFLVSRSQSGVCGCYPKVLVEVAALVCLCDGAAIRTRDHYASAADALSNAPALWRLDIIERQTPMEEPLALIPLLSRLRGLREVRIKAGRINDVDFVLLPAIAHEVLKTTPESPPCAITSLSIHTSRSRPTAANAPPDFGASLHCLQQIARHAQHLESLSIDLAPYFSQTAPGGVDAKNWLPVLRCEPYANKLLTLSVDGSKDRHASQSRVVDFEEADTLAQIVDILFPSLFAIQPFRPADMDLPYWKNYWVHIERQRRMYQRQRT